MSYNKAKSVVSAASSSNAHRLLSLDILRAAAMFLVLFSHSFDPPRDMPEILRKPIVLLDHIGWIGVDLFFVLSGFLVSGLLFREQIKSGAFRIGNFYARRAFKIYPALYFLVFVSIILQTSVFADPPPLRSVLGDLLFLQNYIGAIWGHTWSLAVEEHFYLLLPPTLWLLASVSKNKYNPFTLLPPFFLTVAAIELGLRVYMNASYNYTHGTHLFRSHLRFDSLLFGVLISYFYHYHSAVFFGFVHKWRGKSLLLVSFLVAPLLLLMRDHFLVSTIGLTLIYIWSGIVLCWALSLPSPKHWFAAKLGFIGLHSYSIYLWHYPVVYWVMQPMQEAGYSWFAFTSTYWAVSVVLGILMAKLVEFPVLYLRDKWFPARRSHRDQGEAPKALVYTR